MLHRRFFGPLLLTTALFSPSMAFGQDAGSATAAPPPNAAAEETAADPSQDVPGAEPAAEPAATDTDAQASPEVSVPGGEQEIIIRGSRRTNVQKSSSQVVNVLSSEQIAKTGEGDIAGALQRVTGLSVVGNGFVYVRGLGDRYSLALLNGSPLPSPEPLKRVVPLDIFPTNVVASSLVQKSYSVNFPGEFGGGVINLTTKSIPDAPFLTIGASLGYDNEVTGELGYTYYGSGSDWTGFDNGNRDIPPALRDYFNGGTPLSSGSVDAQAIASQLITAENSLLQRNTDMPANWSANITGGTSFDIGDDARLGVLATLGFSSKWRSRDTIQQTAASADLSALENDFRRVITDNRAILNGMLGFGLELGDQKIRWTNVYVHDTLKQASLGVGTRETTSSEATLMQQRTAWYERQLINSQIVAELKPVTNMTLDLRGGYANSKRKAPDEIAFEYFRSNNASDPYRDLFVNRLNNGQQGSASIGYSDLNEDLWSAGIDLGYRFNEALRVTAGYAFTDTVRETDVRQFLFVAPSDTPAYVGVLRPDVLLSPGVIDFFNIDLIDANEANPIFLSKLRTHAGYIQGQVKLGDFEIVGGVRYETAKQTVTPVQAFDTPLGSTASTNLKNDYWLPAVSVTYQPTPQLQFRASASKTIARPQFRELVFQPYFDPDSNRQFRGNPLLVDSELTNIEARAEYYFNGEQRIAVAGFYKDIKNPIEAFASFSDNAILSSFVNAPRAELYGIEVEALKFFPLGEVAGGPRRLVVRANYTWSKSRLKIEDGDPAPVFGSPNNLATDYFEDGDPMTGQSEHIVNLELGFERTDKLSQQTLLLNYASDRVTNRGAASQPDILERPGIGLDFVAREGFTLMGRDLELKFEARNLLRKRYEEFQELGDNKVFYNRYRIGTTFSLGASLKL